MPNAAAIFAAAALLCLALASARAGAHAIVIAAVPAVNSTVVQGPLDVQLQFNSRVDPQRSRLVLHGPDGTDQTIALAPTAPAGSLSGRADATLPGRWTLRWQVLSLDGHITRGELPFFVRAAGNPP